MKHNDGDARQPLLTRRFVVVVASGIFYFMALGSLLPMELVIFRNSTA